MVGAATVVSCLRALIHLGSPCPLSKSEREDKRLRPDGRVCWRRIAPVQVCAAVLESEPCSGMPGLCRGREPSVAAVPARVESDFRELCISHLCSSAEANTGISLNWLRIL